MKYLLILSISLIVACGGGKGDSSDSINPALHTRWLRTPTGYFNFEAETDADLFFQNAGCIMVAEYRVTGNSSTITLDRYAYSKSDDAACETECLNVYGDSCDEVFYPSGTYDYRIDGDTLMFGGEEYTALP